ncbi:MAG: S8/S53 family peptidase [Candidatus Eremiobacteraeota bacterium]|nr:S8/S53 family peptidase [Candidatus Eremiobacteraeota bacterium]
MNRRLIAALAGALLAACSPMASGAALTPHAALPAHVPAAAATYGYPAGRLAPQTRMEIYVTLPGRNEEQLDGLIEALNTPGSSSYGRYLTPEQYGAYFGADPRVYARAIASLRKAGFTIESLPANRTDIVASAPEQAVERYFATPIDVRNDRGRTFFANRFEPQTPPELSAVAISGLDNYVELHPQNVRPRAIVNGVFSWGPNDIAAAYDLNPLYSAKPALDGRGVTIANATCGAASARDLAAFQKQFGISGFGGTLVTTGIGGAARPGCKSYGNGESSLDVDAALGVARGATFHQVVAASPSNADFDKVYSYIVTTLGSTVHVVTTSWGGCEAGVKGTASLTIDEKLYKQAAAEGQAWFAASGDFGSDDCYGYPPYKKVSVDFPGSSPYVLDVGGTNVKASIVKGNVTAWRGETAWQYANSDGATGGGRSVLFSKPAFQRALTPDDGARDVPDVALLADNHNDGMWVYDGVLQSGWGGTSEAAPQWAGLLAIVVQKHGNRSVRDPHLRLYALAATRAYHALFHDVVGGTNAVPKSDDPYGSFPGYDATRGYDLCTGLGSFIGAALVQAY